MKSKLLSLILALTFLTSFSNAQENKLTAAVPDWTGGEITCQVAVTILEEELGYKVKRVVFPSGTALWQAIADGEIDFACESWPRLMMPPWGGGERGGEWGSGWPQLSEQLLPAGVLSVLLSF